MHSADFLNNVRAYMLAHGMLVRKMHVIVGVSGGADSVCLLWLYRELSSAFDLKITVVHVHHGIRGALADADAAYVQSLCKRWEIPCEVYHRLVPELAKEMRLSEEEAGRKVRYECFEETRLRHQADAIAVAHHKDDVAETILFNLFRGTGLKGLGSMTPVRGYIHRPLLCVTKEEIEALLTDQQLTYCTDLTNYETVYSRNKIRQELLPYIKAQLNTGAAAHIVEVGEDAQEAWAYILDHAKLAFKAIVNAEGVLDVDQLLAEVPLIQKEVLRLWFEQQVGRLKDVTRTHIDSMLTLAGKPDGKRIHLPYGMMAVRKAHTMILIQESKAGPALEQGCPDYAVNVDIPGVYMIPGTSMKLTFSVRDLEENERIPENNCTKWFDYDNIKDGLKLRYRGAGDYMTIAPHNHRKLLRRILMDDKIPGDLRSQICVLASGNHVLWIPNGRISEACKVTQNTKRILILDIKGEDTWKTRSNCY